MKKICAILVLMVSAVCTPLFAKQTVESVCALISKHSVTSGDFVQEKTVPNAKRSLRSSGTFLMCSEGIYLATKKPLESAMGLTKSSLIRVTPDGARTVIGMESNPTFLGIANIISAILAGDKNLLEEHFTAAVSETENVWHMTLVPKDETVLSAVASIELSGDAKNLNSLVMNNAQGGTVSYKFMNHVYGDSLTNAQRALFKE